MHASINTKKYNLCFLLSFSLLFIQCEDDHNLPSDDFSSAYSIKSVAGILREYDGATLEQKNEWGLVSEEAYGDAHIKTYNFNAGEGYIAYYSELVGQEKASFLFVMKIGDNSSFVYDLKQPSVIFKVNMADSLLDNPSIFFGHLYNNLYLPKTPGTINLEVKAFVEPWGI